jgi:hypothetical protein
VGGVMFGWLGATLLALCGLPEAWKAITTSICSLGWAFLLMWGFGELFTLLFVLKKNREVKLLPLIFNYGLNLIFITIMVYIKLRS